jgi:pyruvate formate lyase activating enzyme
MREALLYAKLPDARVQCYTCQWHCKIAPGKYGVCGMYKNREGTLYNLNYGLVSSMAADPIEKKPLFHFFPASTVFSLGTLGCNFHCRHCQNWEIAMVDNGEKTEGCHEISPQAQIDLALSHHCQGVAWTYNEPAIWFEYTLDSAKFAKQKGLYTVYVTNGYSTVEALDMIGPYLDAWRVDIKGFSDKFYQDLAKIPQWREILKTARHARIKWKMHVEVVTNIIPGMNDDDEQLEGIARWIREDLGELTPWHVTRFYPQYRLIQYPATPIATLEHACDIGHKVGLKFVYTGNAPGHPGENTLCYQCGAVVVRRTGYDTRIVGLEGSKCRFCNTELNFKRGLKEGRA